MNPTRTVKRIFGIGVMLLVGAAVASAQDAPPVDMNNKGVGPVKSVTVGAPDAALSAKGKELFAVKCAACHKIGARLVGPDLAGVAARRSPEWIMNMMLNPQEMTQKDPIAQDLFATYLIQMTFQNVKEDEARAILEYLRDAK